MITAPAAGVEALKDLRRARRTNRLENIHWIDALYRVYITALMGGIFFILAAGKLSDTKLSHDSVAKLASQGPAALGLVVAVGLAFGLRSGGRGGPLTLEAPVVHHELLAPVPKESVVRGPAMRQIRFMAFAGMVVGGLIGALGGRSLTGNALGPVVFCALTFSLGAMASAGLAMVVSGRRLPWWSANLAAVAVMAWSILDVTAKVRTSPMTWLGGLAFWSIRVTPVALVSVALSLAVAVAGVAGIGSLSIEAARRRAGLVAQLRFAVTLQDIRTVVLLRRQLSQETPRATPWVRLGRRGRTPQIWRRDWHSYLRFPVPRLMRMALLGAVAGLSLGAMWRGATAMIVLAGLALYLAGYDAAEPIAQEVDHPTRWESYPDDPGRLLTMHLPAAIVTMVLVCSIAAAASLVLVPANVVARLALPMVLVAAVGSAMAAAVSTSLGAPNIAGVMGLGPDLLGFVLGARLVAPPAIALVSLMPLLVAGTDATMIQVNSARVSNAVFYPFFVIIGAGMVLRYRKPGHL